MKRTIISLLIHAQWVAVKLHESARVFNTKRIFEAIYAKN